MNDHPVSGTLRSDGAFVAAWRQAFVSGVDHDSVIARVNAESGWSGRYLFMIAMSAGIAVLGLLLSSPAVVIGAMLISPLMSPILGLGFGLTLFDFVEVRRAGAALLGGAVLGVAFAALIVLVSPLKEPTAEILARTRPNLFDLLVALFAALAGSFAIIRGRGETITGVAIATALMPPLATVGYGLATWNMPVLGGALALFVTNFVTIALSATVMARLYGFGHTLSPRQSWAQVMVLVTVFVAMAIPLGYALARIGREAVTVTQVRALLGDRFGAQSRVTQLDVDFAARPIAVRAVVIAPRDRSVPTPKVRDELATALGEPVTLQLDQVLLQPGSSALDAQLVELAQAKAAEASAGRETEIAHLVALVAGVADDQVTIDRGHQRAQVTAHPLPGASVVSYRALEARVRAVEDGWDITVVPPLQPLPEITFADEIDALDDAGRQSVETSAWAAHRWNVRALGVPGMSAGATPARPGLAERRALAIAAVLNRNGIRAQPQPAAGQHFRLALVDDQAGDQ
ncbi:DUF389 domain-containing protein [Sphingomonas sp. CROZ-RG-20F-R02-07]|uniref:DUF389 domain-containing protein n=1 Tax=Sphingomonas sp. CROZ-RG-20F-R02-07 TaxID=2914832 RepID=UPI001F569D97|nr:DUF389 domain-containing protein [Sphingomonas sp. CROZ-RG-20F-R02-07]